MKPAPNMLVEHYRITNGLGATPRAYGNNGAFRVPRGAILLNVMVSSGAGWDHISISTPERCPTWEEQMHIIELFARSDETWMALRVPAAEHISYHPYTLHWWRPHTEEEIAAIRQEWRQAGEPWPYGDIRPPGPIPCPPSWMVGPKLTREEMARLTPAEIRRRAAQQLQQGLMP